MLLVFLVTRNGSDVFFGEFLVFDELVCFGLSLEPLKHGIQIDSPRNGGDAEGPRYRCVFEVWMFDALKTLPLPESPSLRGEDDELEKD